MTTQTLKSRAVSPREAWRLRQALNQSAFPPSLPECRRFLALFTPAERERFVEALETGEAPPFLHDPAEYDPRLRPKVLAVRAEVAKRAAIERERWIAEQKRLDPGFVAPRGDSTVGAFGPGYSDEVKKLLYQRHAIAWFTPGEIRGLMGG